MRSLRYFDSGGRYDGIPSACQHGRPSTHWSTHMTTKKPAAFLAFAGACALALTGPAALAAPPSDTHPAPGATA